MKQIYNNFIDPLQSGKPPGRGNHSNESSFHDRFYERVQQISSSWYIRFIFISMLVLLFIFPLYDIITGNLSYAIWILFIVSVFLLGYMYLLVYMVGQWDNERKLMLLPSTFLGLLLLSLITFLGAFYSDLFIVSSLYPYFVPIGIAVFSIFVAFVHFVRERRTQK